MTRGSGGGVRFQLSVLWALEWGISGAVLTYLPLYLTDQGINERQLGMLMAVSAVGLWVAPIVVGQICDRWMAIERYLAISHLFGAMLLWAIPRAVARFNPQTGEHFTPLLMLLGCYACAYLPTVPLASALTFRHLADPDRQFGAVRVWGTVGWVGSGWLISLWLGQEQAYVAIDGVSAESSFLRTGLEAVQRIFGWIGHPETADSFRLSAILSLLLGGLCFLLPATPPPAPGNPTIAPLVVLRMFSNRTFFVLIGVSFLLATMIPFYALAVPQLLNAKGIDSAWVPALMTMGQISEFPALLLLGLLRRSLGIKRIFELGILAWVVRYAMFAVNGPVWLTLAGVSLHGICHVFLIVVVQLYVDQTCPRDTRASAQNLFGLVTLGIGMPLGFLASGYLGQLCAISHLELARYELFFGVPAFVLCLIFWIFRSRCNLSADPQF